MNIQREALYISDLDGTLLQGDATLSPYSRQLLNSLLQEGLPFTVASARSIVSMQPILKDVALSLPVIEFNGAFISDLATGRQDDSAHELPLVTELRHQRWAARDRSACALLKAYERRYNPWRSGEQAQNPCTIR